MRRDFVRGILTSDLLGKSIHTHILGEEYAARVRSTQMYDAISRDVIGRWTFPMVPDSNIFDSHTYRYYRNHIYKESSVVLSRYLFNIFLCSFLRYVFIIKFNIFVDRV